MASTIFYSFFNVSFLILNKGALLRIFGLFYYR